MYGDSEKGRHCLNWPKKCVGLDNMHALPWQTIRLWLLFDGIFTFTMARLLLPSSSQRSSDASVKIVHRMFCGSNCFILFCVCVFFSLQFL